jgi:hypothetical protein
MTVSPDPAYVAALERRLAALEAAPAPRRRSRRGRWLRRAAWVFAALLAVCVAIVGDWALRCWEANRLVAAIEASESAMARWRNADDMVYERLPEEPWTEEEYARGSAEVSRVATVYLTEVAVTETGVADLRLAPWHRALVRAQDRYLDHAGAWRGYLADRGEDSTQSSSHYVQIDPTFAIAGPAVIDAVPPWCFGDVRERAERVFAD